MVLKLMVWKLRFWLLKKFFIEKEDTKEDFKINIGSDVDYERLIAEISCRDGTICTISQEREDGKLEIEFKPVYYSKSKVVKCDLEGFKQTLDQAVKQLKGE